MNVKKVLRELGVRLVTEHGFRPSSTHGSGPRDTFPIAAFLRWVNTCPVAQRLLVEYDLTWDDPDPVPPPPPISPDAPVSHALTYLKQKEGCEDARVFPSVARPDIPVLSVSYRQFGAVEWWVEQGVWRFCVLSPDGVVVDQGGGDLKASAPPFVVADKISVQRRTYQRGG